MNHHLPTTDQILRYILSEYKDTDVIDPVQALYAFYMELDSALKIARLNCTSTEEYINYLVYFKKFIYVSERNENSVLRCRLNDAAKLRKLHSIL